MMPELMSIGCSMLPRNAVVVAAVVLALTGCTKKADKTGYQVETGVASWYGHPFDGRLTANGEIYDMEKMTAAHRTLPFGTMLRVVNLDNEKTTQVRINDRGPFVRDRIIDLSHAAAQAISMSGAANVRSPTVTNQ